MPLSPVEQAFAEAVLIEGLVAPPKLAFCIKVKEASPQKKPLPNYIVDLRLLDTDNAKRLWKLADQGVKASPPATFTFSPGAMMGPYVLVEPRGVRSYAGEYWRAKRPEGLGFLRLVPPGTGLDADRAKRLIDRANAGIDAPDPKILRIDDAGEEFNWLYTGTLGFDGESLATRSARKPVSEQEALVLLATIGQALRVAHGFGVVHGGLNALAVVYGTPDAQPRVTDFGIGSAFFDGSAAGMRPGQRIGLLLYAAPELVRGGVETGLDARADLYSAGALVLDAISAVRSSDMRASEDDPWIVKPPVPDGLTTILKRLLQLDPAGRYPSADSLLADVARVQKGALPGPLPQNVKPMIAGRPETAAPLVIVTAELIQKAEAQASQPVTSTEEPALPPEPLEVPPSASGSSGDTDAIPPTIDPDGENAPQKVETLEAPTDDEPAPPSSEETEPPPSGEQEQEETVPPTDDPDRGAPKEKKKPKRLGSRAGVPRAAPKEGSGLVGLFFSMVVVAGAFFGARAATAPDGVVRAKKELAQGYLELRDGKFQKALEGVASARASAPQDTQVADEATALEDEVHDKRAQAYLEARDAPEGLDAASAIVEGSELDCLHRFDAAKRDNPADGQLWDQLGLDLLAQGYPDDALKALEQATNRVPTLAKDRDLALFAVELRTVLRPGKYSGGKLTLAKPVYVGKTAVTREQYARWLEDAKKRSSLHAHCSKKEPENKSHDPDGWSTAVALAMKDPRPATGVDVWDAIAYANARGGRLANAAERTALAQGRGTRERPWGPGAAEPSRTNAAGFWGELLPAGALVAGPGALGGLDLLGNCEEWTASENEDDGFVCGADFETAADKLSLEPRIAKITERSPRRGFRCALDVPQKKE